MTTDIKAHAPFIALALITITLSSWGLFRLLVDFAACPPWFACLAVGGADLLAVVCGKQAIDVAADGDSPAFWNAVMLAITGLAAWLQFAHTQLAGQPLAIGVIMAVFPVATVLLFEGRLRRSARLQGRAQGRVAPPRATVPLLVWVRFPVEAWHATSQAIRAQGHLDAGAVEGVRLQRSELNRTNGKATQAGQSVAASAQAAADRLGTRDPETVWLEVRRTTHPDVSRDTVRRSLSRIPTNGHKELTDV